MSDFLFSQIFIFAKHTIKRRDMEDFNAFDLSGLMTEEELQEVQNPAEENEEKNTPPDNQADGGDDDKPDESRNENADAEKQERVGDEDNKEREDANDDTNKGSSSPDVFYSSIARVAKKDGIFSNLSEEFIEKIKGPEDFGEALEQEISARLDERQKVINDLLTQGATVEEVKSVESIKSTLDYLQNITEVQLSEVGEDGASECRKILYNDFLVRGFSEDRARREVQKSFNAGTEVDDAKESLDSLIKYYEKEYNTMLQQRKRAYDSRVEQQRKNAETYRKMILEDDITLGESKLTKQQRQKIYDITNKASYKDPETGALMTELQKYQKEHPLEFLKQIGMWFVLTDGGKNMSGFTKAEVAKEKHKAMRELESKILMNSADGALQYVGGGSGGSDDDDILLSDDWNVGFGQ